MVVGGRKALLTLGAEDAHRPRRYSFLCHAQRITNRKDIKIVSEEEEKNPNYPTNQ